MAKDRYYYDSKGNYRGRASSDSPFAVGLRGLIFLLIVFGGAIIFAAIKSLFSMQASPAKTPSASPAETPSAFSRTLPDKALPETPAPQIERTSIPRIGEDGVNALAATAPANQPELAQAIREGLSTGIAQTWNADSGGLSGGVSVSSAATYPDGKLCRNFRYSVRRGTDEWASDAILACSGDGVTWTYDNNRQ